jgi:hypothetical protein
VDGVVQVSGVAEQPVRLSNVIISPGGGLQVAGRPLNIRGAYSTTFRIFLTGGQPAGALYMFRYTGTGVCVVTDIYFGAIMTGVSTSQTQLFTFDRYTNWTANDTGSGQSPALTPKRNTYPPAQVSTLQALIATPLTTAASTFAGQIFPLEFAIIANTIATVMVGQRVFGSDSNDGHPLMFAQNEGFRINGPSVSGSGTALIINGHIHWFEASVW